MQNQYLNLTSFFLITLLSCGCVKMEDRPKSCMGNVTYSPGTTAAPTDFIAQGNVGSSDIILSKFSKDGARLWTRLIGTSGEDRLPYLAEKNGSLYLTAGFKGSLNGIPYGTGNADTYLFAFASSSLLGWMTAFYPAGALGSNSMITGELTSDGTYVYVTGSTTGSIDGNAFGGTVDVYAAKYSTTGAKQFIRQYGTSGGAGFAKVVVDSSQQMYISHQTSGTLTEFSSDANVILTGLDISGAKRWQYLYQSAGYDIVMGIAVDGSDVIVEGYTYGNIDGVTNSTGADVAWISKINSSGVVQWTKIPFPAIQSRGDAVFVDSQSNIYWSVSVEDTNGFDSCQIWKLNSSGTVTWQSQYIVGHCQSLAVDTDGSIYAHGTHSVSGCPANAMITKINGSTGYSDWWVAYGTKDGDYGASLVFDTSDNTLVATATAYVTEGVIESDVKPKQDPKR